MFFSRYVLLILFSLCLAACGAPQANLPDGNWRAVITTPGGELAVNFTVSGLAGDAPAVIVHNASEQIAVPEVEFVDDVLTLRFPAFNNTFVLRRQGNMLSGDLTLIKRGGEVQIMPVTLTPGQEHRFFAGEQDVNADFDGIWRVEFIDEDGVLTQSVGEFEQRNGHVTGTIRNPNGDYRYLQGQVQDRTLYLSTFDGAHVFLFVATQSSNGLVAGDFWSGTQWHESFSARRDAQAALPNPLAMSQVVGESQQVEFSFPNTSGVVVSSSDPRFADKVTVIALAGSWCPNCHDEAAYLAPFYARHKDRGLEIVSLMFEHLEDFDLAAAQVDKFRAKFDIQYELLVAGFSDKQVATETLGWLDKVIAYPTMVVLDRSGKVRRVHTGFEGPATGLHYQTFVAEFETFIDQLLAEGES